MKRLKLKVVNGIFILALLVGAVVGLYGACAESVLLCGTGMAVIFGDILFRIIFYRCPHCGKFLDRSEGKFCPHCGEEIDE